MKNARHRDRLWFAAALAAAVMLGGVCLGDWPNGTIGMGHHGSDPGMGHGVGVWVFMMSAMMLPVVGPAVFRFVEARQRKCSKATVVSVLTLLAGYLLVWSAFSIAAALLQGPLHELAMGAPRGLSLGAVFAGGLLMTAGAFQWSRAKQRWLCACRMCRNEFNDTRGFAITAVFTRGLRHGLRCLGCCWALMLLMFVGGVMSVPGMVVLTAFMVLERIVPDARAFTRASGAVLGACGLAVAAAAWQRSATPEFCSVRADASDFTRTSTDGGLSRF